MRLCCSDSPDTNTCLQWWVLVISSSLTNKHTCKVAREQDTWWLVYLICIWTRVAGEVDTWLLMMKTRVGWCSRLPWSPPGAEWSLCWHDYTFTFRLSMMINWTCSPAQIVITDSRCPGEEVPGLGILDITPTLLQQSWTQDVNIVSMELGGNVLSWAVIICK